MLEAFAKVPLKLESESLCQNLLLFFLFFYQNRSYGGPDFEYTITKNIINTVKMMEVLLRLRDNKDIGDWLLAEGLYKLNFMFISSLHDIRRILC